MSAANGETVSRYFTDTEVAIVCHYQAIGLQLVLGDPVSAIWEHFPLPRRQLVIESVRAVKAGASPREIHELWREGMERLGIAHANGVPFDALRPGQRLKDQLFVLTVAGMASAER
jgi:hypothetical protein